MNPVDASGTAQAFSSLVAAVTAIGALSPAQIALYILGAGAGFLASATVSQHILEVINAYIKPPLWLKVFMPKILSGAIGWMLKTSGMDTVSAGTAAATFAAILEAVHNSPLSLQLEAQVKTTLQGWVASKVISSVKGSAPSLLFLVGLGLLLIPRQAPAALALSNNAGLGSSVYTIQNDGSWLPTGGTLLSDNLNLSFGSLNGTAFSEYVGLSLGAGFESRNGEQFGDALLGLTIPVPTADGDIFIGPSWRLFTGDNYPGVAVSANFQLGQPLKIWP
jgi:hypothetical protein